MKSFRSLLTLASALIFSCLLDGCKKENPPEDESWPDDQVLFVGKVLDFQKVAEASFRTWSKSMDSISAVNKLKDYFEASPNVSSASLSGQGISVEYRNGMRSGQDSGQVPG